MKENLLFVALFNEEFVLTSIMRHRVDTSNTFRLNPPLTGAAAAAAAAAAATATAAAVAAAAAAVEPDLSPKLKTPKQPSAAERIKAA